jgi:hypothetical protein
MKLCVVITDTTLMLLIYFRRYIIIFMCMCNYYLDYHLILER